MARDSIGQDQIGPRQADPRHATARRTFKRAGGPRSVAAAIVGHKTESVYRRHAVVDEALQREAAPRLDACAQSPRLGRFSTFEPIRRRARRTSGKDAPACRFDRLGTEHVQVHTDGLELGPSIPGRHAVPDGRTKTREPFDVESRRILLISAYSGS